MNRFLCVLITLAVGAAGQTLHPKVEAAVMKPATLAELRAAFADPAAEYRSMPLWVWNDQLEWPRLREQLASFKQQGIGGVFIHPRPGLMTEYLGADWLRLWRQSADEGKRLGMIVNIYDENSYPSGFGGGAVPSRAPDTASQYVQVDLDVNPGAIDSQRATAVAFMAVRRGNAGAVVEARRVRSRAEVPPAWTVAAFRLRRASGNPWTGEFPYVDLTNPQTTRNFLDSTYEVYKKTVGDEFGKTVRWSFTDEPLIATGGAYDNAKLALPLSFNTLAEFRKRNGYDLADEIGSLYWDTGDFRKVRFDYWQTLHDLWKEHFMAPMFEWCDRNGLQFTGHWMEHEWPAPWITPDDGSLYAFEHMPGIDMLEGATLRATGSDPHMLFTIKQVASVSHQLGRRAFCEAYGVSGWDSTFEHYKRFGDWLLAHGVNFIDQHLAYATVRGARKRDHPQSFTDVSPWWPYYRTHADHLARVSLMSARSEARNRLLVLEPTTSGFLLARRDGPTPELSAMRTANADLNQFLADRQVDFDLGDEYMIEWFGKEGARKFTIGKASYDIVVWPENMTNIRRQTLPHLESYLASGGTILAMSAPAVYVDGRASGEVAALAARYRAQWKTVAGREGLFRALRETMPARVELDHPIANVGLLDRWLPGGERVLFFANSANTAASARATVDGASVELWDTATGRIGSAAYTAAGGKVSFAVALAPAGSAMFVVKKSAGTPLVEPSRRVDPLQASQWRVTADSPNVLVLDYCDVAVGKSTLADVNTWQANWEMWQRHGFERPAWDNAVQYKTRVFDRNHFGTDSGFDATFHFTVASGQALKALQLAIETPELYKVTVNGKAVSFAAGKRWKDPHIRAASIAGAARVGDNEVVISAHPFDVRMELENIYLLGDFQVTAAARGFRIDAPAKLDFGWWTKQGMPFFGDAVTYETKVTVPAGTKAIGVELAEWSGSVAAVLVDGKVASTLGWQPYRAEIPVNAGVHTVAVRVVSTPRNTFGPYHNSTKPRMRAWPAAWADFPPHQPAGMAYDVLEYGLTSAPALTSIPAAR